MSRADLLTLDEVAALLKVDPRTVSRWCKDGRLAYVALPSGRVRIRRTDLDAMLVNPS